MNIQYLAPLSRGWERMKTALFQPFDLKKWFVVGFTAFLAGLTDWHGGGGSGAKSRGRIDWDDVVYFPYKAWEWLLDNPGWFTLYQRRCAFADFVYHAGVQHRISEQFGPAYHIFPRPAAGPIDEKMMS